MTWQPRYEIVLPMRPNGTYNFSIDWQDGSPLEMVQGYRRVSHRFKQGLAMKPITIILSGVFSSFFDASPELEEEVDLCC